MSSDKSFLALRLEGPLQSWGFDSQYNRRNTGLMPTKSAIAGICCAAFGYQRGSAEESEFLKKFIVVKMLAVALPREEGKTDLSVRRLQDYHTVGGGYDPNKHTERGSITISAEDGKPRAKNGQALAVLSHRQYLTDASFGVILEGDANLLHNIAYGDPKSNQCYCLADPKWGVWLGRKTCIPTAPILAGLQNNREEALKLILKDKPLELYTRQEEVENFADGRDSLPDVPVSFALDRRQFSPRRVKMWQAGEQG